MTNVRIARTENGPVSEINFVIAGAYHDSRWADSGRFPTALIVKGELFLHNAVAKACQMDYDGTLPSIRYGAGRSAARYEHVTADRLLAAATRDIGEAPVWNQSQLSHSRDLAQRAAFAALIEAL